MKIEFRAKDKDTGRWHKGYYVFHLKTMLCCATDKEVEENEEHLLIFDGCCDWNLPMPWYKCTIDENTLGQNTNVKDSKGKDVFPGDILEDDIKRRFIVYSAPGGFRVCHVDEWTKTNGHPILESGLSEPQNVAWTEQSVEVIGNIYDNPEIFTTTV